MHVRRPTRFIICIPAIVCVSIAAAAAQEKKTDGPTISEEASKLKRVPPRSAVDSMKELVLRDGFQVERVASEPLIHDPVAIDFDEDGRAYVVELPPYNSYVIEDFKHGGSIRLLEDTDDDGVFDKSTVFADGFKYPTAVGCWDGGVFVGASPDLIYLKDNDGDGKADERKVIFTGFGADKAGEAHLNSFRWGFDNRIHISTNLSGGEIRATADNDAKPISVRGRGFIFDPRDLSRFELTSGGGQHGLSMDNWGRKFVCSNSVPAQTLMYDDRYVARNPHVKAPAAAVDIAPEGKFTKLFRISPPEPWRELRTRLRKTGKFRGSDEGGKPFGFFTGATGITIYRGDAWPSDYRGNLIVGDVANNLIYRATLEANGVGLTARRADPGAEFLAARDIWFRPVQFANAPDGSLFVLDMYRGLIEGAAFLPPEFLKFIDPVSGHEKGRIYRIVTSGHKHRPTPRLSKSTTAELVSLLEHPNGWHRDTASRLIYQRQDKSAAGALRKLVRTSVLPEGRMTALYSLQGLASTDEASVLHALDDTDPNVRIHALRVAESQVSSSTALRTKLVSMVADKSRLVRYQLAFSLGTFGGPERDRALAALAKSDGDDRWFRLAIQSSLSEGASDVFQLVSADAALRSSTHEREFLTTLAEQIGSANRPFETAAVLRLVQTLPADEKPLSEALIQALVKSRKGEDREKLLAAAGGKASEIVSQMLREATAAARNSRLAPTERAAAVRTLGFGSYADTKKLLTALLDKTQPQPVQLATLDVLAGADDPSVPQLILDAWPAMSPTVRSRSAETVFSRTTWTKTFLEAVSSGDISRADVAPSRVALLKSHRDDDIRSAAAKIFSADTSASRAKVVAKYQRALKLEGNSDRGRELFRKECSGCHRLEGFGTAIGADLKAVGDRGSASILLNILDPNREVKPKFVTYVVITEDGRSVSGMIVSENANSVTLRRLDKTEVTIQRIDIDELRSTGLSFMPEGLEKQVTVQGAADLLEYLRSAGA